MPYKRHHPINEDQMNKSKFEGHHTICQTLRDIYHMTNNPEIKLKCRVGMSMSKAMHKKLKKYKQQEEKRSKQCQQPSQK